MKKFLILFTIIFALLLSSCAARVVRGSGDVVSEVRDVQGFDQVDVCCGMELYLSQGSSESLEIEAEDNILPELVSSVHGGVLEIGFRDQYPEAVYLTSKPIRVYVTMIEVTGIEVSGGGDLFAETIDAGELVVRLSGGSDAQIDQLSADNLEIDVTGGGDVEIAGQVIEQQLFSSGGSSYTADELESDQAVMYVSGGGHATVWVNEKLSVDASGGSKIAYYGEPRLTSESSGGSSLNSLGMP